MTENPALTPEQVKDLALEALDNIKAKDVVCMEVKPITSIADYMIVCSGTSSRHLKAIADELTETSKKAGHQPTGVEGEGGAEWVLVDLGDVIAHIMLPDTRRFYDLEKLWSLSPEQQAQQDDG